MSLPQLPTTDQARKLTEWTGFTQHLSFPAHTTNATLTAPFLYSILAVTILFEKPTRSMPIQFNLMYQLVTALLLLQDLHGRDSSGIVSTQLCLYPSPWRPSSSNKLLFGINHHDPPPSTSVLHLGE